MVFLSDGIISCFLFLRKFDGLVNRGREGFSFRIEGQDFVVCYSFAELLNEKGLVILQGFEMYEFVWPRDKEFISRQEIDKEKGEEIEGI